MSEIPFFYQLLHNWCFDKPAIVFAEKISFPTTDLRGISDASATDFQRGCRSDVKHTVDRVLFSVLPDKEPWENRSVFSHQCIHINIHLAIWGVCIGTSLVDQTSCFFPVLFALRLNHGEVSILYINNVHLSIGFLEFN